MRTILFFVLLLIWMPFLLFSQERNDAGLIAGVSYYMGDYNPSTHFYKPSPAIGVLFRRNFNDLYSLRVTGAMGWLRGSHDPEEFFLPGETPSFSKRIIEIDGVVEIGFIPFNTHRHKRSAFTPYVAFGAGIAYVNRSIIPHIPMGVGIKYSPVNRWTLGLEWRVHKTFFDGIDDYINISDEPKSFIHNNDWFSFAGFFVSYRIFKQSAICPAYM